MKILAVDDDTNILALLKVILADVGFKDITVCSQPLEALTMLKSDKASFDCVVLDIQMPELDGIQLCRKIRMINGYEKKPIIMLTAMTQISYIEEAFVAGATDYITKPFDVVEIGARIRVAAQLSAANVALAAAQNHHRQRHHAEVVPKKNCISRSEITELFSAELNGSIGSLLDS